MYRELSIKMNGYVVCVRGPTWPICLPRPEYEQLDCRIVFETLALILSADDQEYLQVDDLQILTSHRLRLFQLLQRASPLVGTVWVEH